MLSPLAPVSEGKLAHEVRGYRDRGVDLPHLLRFSYTQAAQLTINKACMIQHLRRVVLCGHLARQVDVGEVAVGLRPKSRVPRVIQRVNRTVFLTQPRLKLPLAGIAVTAVNVATILVVDVPHNESWVVRKFLRECCSERH